MTTNDTHKLLSVLEPKTGSVLSVEMKHGDVFRLKIAYPIDTSIYGKNGGWNSHVVLMVNDPENKFHRPGNGLDFYEEDVQKIIDEATGELIYSAPAPSK